MIRRGIARPGDRTGLASNQLQSRYSIEASLSFLTKDTRYFSDI
jgi:hypothetical protein